MPALHFDLGSAEAACAALERLRVAFDQYSDPLDQRDFTLIHKFLLNAKRHIKTKHKP